MAKTACEEAAKEFLALAKKQEYEAYELDAARSSGMAERLRAEGRELKRLRKMFAAGVTVDRGIGFRGLLARNAQEKARKAK